MERKITCFEWQSRASEFMDGVLPEPLREESDAHLKECEKCSDSYQHYRSILSALASMPRAILPVDISRHTRLPAVPRIETLLIKLGQWDRLPWYLRTFLEGTGIVLVVLIGISIAPNIRSLYERSLEKHLNDYKDQMAASQTGTATGLDAVPAVQTAGKNPEGQALDANGDSISGEADDADDESDGEENSVAPKDAQKGPAVAGQQLWRFTLKTVSPDELRPQVIQALTKLGVSISAPGIGGIQVPGGIEFDLLLPQEIVTDLKLALEKLVANTTERQEDFSWYRVHSKAKIPAGKSKVVIWLSQPH